MIVAASRSSKQNGSGTGIITERCHEQAWYKTECSRFMRASAKAESILLYKTWNFA